VTQDNRLSDDRMFSCWVEIRERANASVRKLPLTEVRLGCERTLHTVRDHEAEKRRERALNGLISLLAQKIVDDLIAEEPRVGSNGR